MTYIHSLAGEDSLRRASILWNCPQMNGSNMMEHKGYRNQINIKHAPKYHNKALTKIQWCTDQFHFKLDTLRYIRSVTNPEITCKIIFSGNKTGQFKNRQLCDNSIGVRNLKVSGLYSWFQTFAVSPLHDQQHCYHHAPMVKPEAATALLSSWRYALRTPETCWAVFKRQVINLKNCCI
jgi:hypothetical protein